MAITRLLGPAAVGRFAKNLQQVASSEISVTTTRGKRTSCRDIVPVVNRSCFDLNDLKFMRGQHHHRKIIKNFMYKHFWPVEPSIQSAGVPIDSYYLKLVTNKHTSEGYRTLAFHQVPFEKRTRLVGLVSAQQLGQTNLDILTRLADTICCYPSRNRINLIVELIRRADLFEKYNAVTILHIEVLAVPFDLYGRGIGTKLLDVALKETGVLGFPLALVVATNAYVVRMCQKLGMKREGGLKFDDVAGDCTGTKVYWTRRPHEEVVVFTKKPDFKHDKNPPSLCYEPPCTNCREICDEYYSDNKVIVR